MVFRVCSAKKCGEWLGELQDVHSFEFWTHPDALHFRTKETRQQKSQTHIEAAVSLLLGTLNKMF